MKKTRKILHLLKTMRMRMRERKRKRKRKTTPPMTPMSLMSPNQHQLKRRNHLLRSARPMLSLLFLPKSPSKRLLLILKILDPRISSSAT